MFLSMLASLSEENILEGGGVAPMTTPRDKAAVSRISRTRKELLSKYATAAGFLYGVISIPEFADVFNHYEDEKTDAGGR